MHLTKRSHCSISCHIASDWWGACRWVADGEGRWTWNAAFACAPIAGEDAFGDCAGALEAGPFAATPPELAPAAKPVQMARYLRDSLGNVRSISRSRASFRRCDEREETRIIYTMTLNTVVPKRILINILWESEFYHEQLRLLEEFVPLRLS